jgi:hypothetical protein
MIKECVHFEQQSMAAKYIVNVISKHSPTKKNEKALEDEDCIYSPLTDVILFS